MSDAEPADGSDPGDVEGGGTLDGPTAEDTIAGEPELAWPDTGDATLLGTAEVAPELAPDGTLLLSVGETCELRAGLAEPLGLMDEGGLDAWLALAGGGGLPEIGEPELGAVMLDATDVVLLGIADDCADGLPTLDAIGLRTDDVSEGDGRIKLPDDIPAELRSLDVTPELTGEERPELFIEGTLETPLGCDDPLCSDEGPETLDLLSAEAD